MAAWFRAVCSRPRGEKCRPETSVAPPLCGDEVQDIFFSLKEEEGSDAYEKATKTLSKHFQPKINVPYERYCFRSMAQEDGESIEQFIVRLRQRAIRCNFQNADEEIRDQVIEKCKSHKIRSKLLIRGQELTLDDLRTIAATVELTDKQTRQMGAGAHESQAPGASASVNAVQHGTCTARPGTHTHHSTGSVFAADGLDTSLRMETARLRTRSVTSVVFWALCVLLQDEERTQQNE